MKLDINDFIMHRNAMDVCLEITNIVGTVAYVRFWNLGYIGKPWILDYTDYSLELGVLETKLWRVLDPEDMVKSRITSDPPVQDC